MNAMVPPFIFFKWGGYQEEHNNKTAWNVVLLTNDLSQLYINIILIEWQIFSKIENNFR